MPKGPNHSAADLAAARRPLSCFHCTSREQAEWCVLKDDDLQLLTRVKVANTYRPGQVIFYQGNPCLGLYCIESGTVALRKSDPSGASALLRMAHGGDTLGYRTFFAGGAYHASAEVLTEARVCFIDRAAVEGLLQHNPALGHRFIMRMADALAKAEDAQLQMLALPVRARLSHLLLVLKDRFATVDDEGIMRIELPLARQDMAAMIGARPETIARAIKALERDQVATFEQRTVVVPDLDALLNEIEPGALVDEE